VTFFWASLGRTYYQTIEHGRLWTGPRRNGSEPVHRRLIKELETGDIVFHYADTELRAISRVSAPWVDAPRPEEHPNPNGDPNGGWLVRVEVLVSDLHVHFEQIVETIGIGPGTPFGSNGRLVRGQYLHRLSDEDGDALLALTGQDALAPGDHDVIGLAGWEGATDAASLRKVRLEQRELRRDLLGRRSTAACALCGRQLPARLLAAAHIVPRRHLGDAERGKFRDVAMLACVLGCDALHELGYITVGASGRIESGKPSATADLRNAVAALIGRECSAFNERTAAAFARHAEMALE